MCSSTTWARRAAAIPTQFGGAIVNNQIAYIASSTNTGGSTQDGVGRVLVVDYSNPAALSVLGEVDIPGTYQVVAVAVQGDEALVVGKGGGRPPAPASMAN